MSTSAPAPTTLDVSQVIDNSAIRPLHVALFALCLLCMIVDGFDVQALGYTAPAIIQEWRIAPALLGPVFGAGNFGVLVGQLSLAVLADRVGRRPVLIAGALFFGVMTLVTAQVVNIPQLLAVRFVAGIGLGSIVPNITALISEFSPRKRRIVLLTWIGTGYTAGAAIGGFLAAWMIPRFGWPSVFYLGGAIPLVLAALMFIWLPESLKLLVLRDRNSPKDMAYIAKWLRRVDPTVHVTGATTLVVPEENRSVASVMGLFRDGRATTTVLFWVVNFMNLLNVYSLSNWLPTVVRGAGYSTSTAVLVGTTLQVGGTLAPFLLAWAVVRRGFIPVLTTTFAVATIAVALIGQPGLPLALLVAVVFVAGAGIVGAQPTVNVLSATYYPTYLRSTGLGWGLGIGRAGAIVGPVVAGWFIALQWSTHAIFLALAVPALISTVFVFALRRTRIPDRTSA